MAANGTPDFSTVLDQLGGSLDSVQAALEPLLARPLEETLAELPGPIERAKVLFWIAYTIHSCSWVYAKTRGADVENHGVLDELKRIQPYNGKINAASKQTASGAPGGDKRTFKIDKDAASRFIKAGTHNKAGAPSASSSFYTSKATVDDPRDSENDGPGVHSRLSSLSRNAIGKGKKPEEADSNDSSSSSEEGDLQVHDDENEGTAAPRASGAVKGKKRKWNAEGIIEGEDDSAQMGAVDDASKKPAQDPLQGYDGSTTPSAQGLTGKQKKRAEKKLKKRQQEQLANSTLSSSAATSLVSSPAPSASSTGDAGEGSSSGGKAKKRMSKKVAE